MRSFTAILRLLKEMIVQELLINTEGIHKQRNFANQPQQRPSAAQTFVDCGHVEAPSAKLSDAANTESKFGI